MSGQPKVLLMTLAERVSAKGTRYLSGWLGKAKVVAFQGDADQWGNETWNLFVESPPPKDGDGRQARPTPAQRDMAERAQSPRDFYDDRLGDL